MTGVGPVAQALGARAFDHAFLVADHDGEPISRYREWLDARVAGTVLSLLHEPLTGPTEFGEIYEAAVRACEQALGGDRGDQPLAVRGGGGRPLQGRPLPPAGWGWDTEVELGPGRVNLTGDTMYDASQRIVADYVLRLWRMPLAILEAKAEGNPASDGMQQASRYAQRLGLRFSIASNVPCVLGLRRHRTRGGGQGCRRPSRPPRRQGLLRELPESRRSRRWPETVRALAGRFLRAGRRGRMPPFRLRRLVRRSITSVRPTSSG